MTKGVLEDGASFYVTTLRKRQNVCTDLSDLPLGILRRAQHFVSQDKPNPEDSDTVDEGENPYDGTHAKGKYKDMSEPSSKHGLTIAKRWNKHA
jgi:hypothetical protein